MVGAQLLTARLLTPVLVTRSTTQVESRVSKSHPHTQQQAQPQVQGVESWLTCSLHACTTGGLQACLPDSSNSLLPVLIQCYAAGHAMAAKGEGLHAHTHTHMIHTASQGDCCWAHTTPASSSARSRKEHTQQEARPRSLTQADGARRRIHVACACYRGAAVQPAAMGTADWKPCAWKLPCAWYCPPAGCITASSTEGCSMLMPMSSSSVAVS
jgi:hypothetical protein